MKVIGQREYELAEDIILCNDVVFPHEFNPHNVRLWVIGNEYGPIAAVWAANEQDAFDILIDENLGGTFLVDDPDPDIEYAYFGNASEPCNLDYAWIEAIDLEKQELPLLLAFAEARGGGYDNLNF
jgi:hypothetical protein